MAKRGLTKKKVLNFLWAYPGNEFLCSVIGKSHPFGQKLCSLLEQ